MRLPAIRRSSIGVSRDRRASRARRFARTLTPPRVPSFTTEGVIYAKKDFNLPAHPEIKEVPNLQVRAARSRESGEGMRRESKP